VCHPAAEAPQATEAEGSHPHLIGSYAPRACLLILVPFALPLLPCFSPLKVPRVE